jgi:rRNA-processing protein FCF1
MASGATRYPILVDTDALIAVANSSLWSQINEHIGLTTTNVCKQELKRHVENTRETAPEGSRPYRLHNGSRAALDALEDVETPLTQVTSVPRPHGADAGEESLRQEVVQNPEAVDYVILMDAAGRRSIRRAVDDLDEDIRVVAPPFLFYILYDNDLISRREFCEACGELLEREGWTGYNAVKAAWEGIPIDCSDILDDHLLP